MISQEARSGAGFAVDVASLLGSGAAALRTEIPPACGQPVLPKGMIHPTHLFLCHPSSSRLGKLMKQFPGLCSLGAAPAAGNDSIINGFTRCRHTPSHHFTAVTELHGKVSFSDENVPLFILHTVLLTPAHGINTAPLGGHPAQPNAGFGAQRWPGRVILGI